MTRDERATDPLNGWEGWQLDPDPLTPPDEPQPAPRRRSGCLGWVVVAVVVGWLW